MTVTHPLRFACAVLLGIILLLVDAIPTAAHAELVSSDPPDKAEVQAPFDGPIVLAFDEALAPGSKADLKAPDGATMGAATVDGDKLVFTLDVGLAAPGGYTIQWTSVGADRDVERGTLTFTVVASSPTARPPAPSATPATTASPSASPGPSGVGTPATGTADVLFPLLAAVIALGALGAFLLNRNRQPAGR